MKVVVETPPEFQGAVMGLLNQRRGMIIGSQDEGVMCAIEAQVPLAEMFGFSTILRSATAYGRSPRLGFDITINEFSRELALGRTLEVYDDDTWRPPDDAAREQL